MKISRLAVASCAILVALAQCSKDPNEQAITISRDSVESFMKRQKIPGAAVTVYKEGKMVWSEGFGFADLEQKVSVYPAKTKFRIGSISKSLTAAGLGKLYEQKKIIFDSSFYYYFPDFPKKLYRPTVRQLAGHLAGFRHYKGPNEFGNKNHYPTVVDGLAMFKDEPLLFEPGTKFEYSTHGFDLLSAVMEKASDDNFVSFMSREVFTPLELSNTRADVNDSIVENRTGFYELRNGRWVNGPYVDNSYKWAGGGFISTSEDIAKFGNALLNTEFLQKETIDILITPQQLKDGTSTEYGMGFGSGKDDKGLFQFGHSGGSVGGSCNMIVYPDQKIVVVALTNQGQVDLMLLTFHLAQLYMK